MPPQLQPGVTTTTHSELVAAVLDLFNLSPGCYAFPTHGLERPVEEGIADILVCCYGFLVALEVKIPPDKQRVEQVEFERRIELAHGDYFVISSLDDAIEVQRSVTFRAIERRGNR